MRHIGSRKNALVGVALSLVLAGGGVAACSGSSRDSTSTAAGAFTAGPEKGAPGRAAAGAAAPALAPNPLGNGGNTAQSNSGGLTAKAVDLAAAGRSRILTGAVDVAVPDVPRAVLLVTAQTTGAGGFVGSEDTIAASKTQGALSTMTLRVPNGRFDVVMAGVSRLGKVRSSTRSETDVTGQVADLNSRLASEQASITRIRLLFAKATNVGAVIALESALTDRESTLESLQAQSRALSGQVSYATITLTLRGPVPPAAVKKVHAAAGFGTGLHAGWHAVEALVRGVAVVLGTLIPFLPAIVVLAVAAWWLNRRLRRRRTPTPLITPAPPAPTPSA